MKILDPCCGTRMMWFDRKNQLCLFGDIRKENISVKDTSHGNKSGVRHLEISPDSIIDFRCLPFSDKTFQLVVFDPPHIARAGSQSWQTAKYGKLSASWRDDISAGFKECFRALKEDGVLIFKWNETQIKVGEILPLSQYRPLFGHQSGKRSGTHWITFMKTNQSE